MRRLGLALTILSFGVLAACSETEALSNDLDARDWADEPSDAQPEADSDTDSNLDIATEETAPLDDAMVPPRLASSVGVSTLTSSSPPPESLALGSSRWRCRAPLASSPTPRPFPSPISPRRPAT